MTVDVSRYSAAPDDERRYETAIARRNTTWAYFEAAAELLRYAQQQYSGDELRPYLRNYNGAQREWERAVYDLTRERVFYQLARKSA